DWFGSLGISLAILLGLAAIGIATRRGRQAVRDVVNRSRPLAKPGPPADPVRLSSTPQAFIAGLQGECAGRIIPLDHGAVVIGRDPSRCQLVLPNSCRRVSKRHCVLRFDHARGKYLLEDLGSANGTFVTSEVQSIKDLRLHSGEARELNPSD